MNSIKYRNKIALWLFICCFFIFLIVLVGGLTRLTGSGLSMTDWHPIHGIIPPINDAEWSEEFAQYQQSPEFQQINFDMSLSEFKIIFYWEYIHRILGRIIGLLLLVPFIIFLSLKAFDRKRAIGIGSAVLLTGVQGLIGWWMVKSGLTDDARVSHFRLATHLGIALIIFGICLWYGLHHYLSQSKIDEIKDKIKLKSLRNTSSLLVIFVFIQIILGAFVSGLDAGLIYNSWPLMGGQVIPDEAFNSGLNSILYDVTTIQFIHRWFAFIVLGLIIFYFVKLRKLIKNNLISGKILIRLKKSANMMIAVTCLQIILGIKTLILNVPTAIASAHQIMAVILLANVVYIRCVFSKVKNDD